MCVLSFSLNVVIIVGLMRSSQTNTHSLMLLECVCVSVCVCVRVCVCFAILVRTRCLHKDSKA